MEGMEATTDLFINLIQNNRIIYDKSLKDFKNTRKKEEVWQDIANQSRMTVDNAKKRYASLRQKYSREKRNCEVKRRNKIAVSRNWIYYERLHFLDSFIQPRSTYTNDTFVEEDDDSVMLNECGMEDTEDASGVTSKTIEIELENGINIDELGDFPTDDTDTGVNASVQLEIPRDVQNDPDHHQSDENIWNRRERIVSKYSHEQSTIEYQSLTEPRVTSQDNENDTAIGDIQQQSENGQQPDDANVMELDNYMSPHPSTSSSIRNTTIPPYPSRCYDPKTGEIVIARTDNQARSQIPSNNHQLNDVGASSHSAAPKNTTASVQPSRSNQTLQPTTSSVATTIRSNPSGQQPDDANVMDLDNYMSPHPSTSSSIRNTTIPPYPSRCYDPKTGEIVIARTANQARSQIPSNNHQLNDVGVSSHSAAPKNTTASVQPSRSNQTRQPTTSSVGTTIRSNPSTGRSTVVPNIVPVASTSVSASNENRMDAIRQRMESCLTAITKKVSDKAQKSPHGPFLSYLGTRLQSVPKETLPRLEREILDLVDQFVS